MSDLQRFAAIDIGSNTFRLMIAEANSPGTATPWHIIHYTHDIIRLGEGLHHSGELSDAAMARGLAAFETYAALLAQFNVNGDHVLAVATAAMREAGNGTLFRDKVAEQTGIQIEIIGGETEAVMSLSGSCAVLLPEMRSNMLLFDIGGASTEFIRAAQSDASRNHGEMITRDAISTKMGVVRLVEAHLHTDPPSPSDYQAMLAAADAHLVTVDTYWGDCDAPASLVGTAGTVTTLAATALDLCPYDADVINNYRMSRADFEALRDRLLIMNHEQRQSIRTIEPGRADLIVAGLAIVEAVMNHWHYDELVIVDAGLLEGAWLTISKQ
ncbi:MAG: Ppx/GppA phosphatase family protein [Mariprofundus sp.]|nr:Ppx/GppA phosphatase family protein [Mariprofundus sp.]